MSVLSRFLSSGDAEGPSGEEADAPSPVADTEVGIDDALNLLANSRRRQVIKLLWREPGGELTIGELAVRIAAIECDCEPEDVIGEQRKRVYVGLYQCHLDKLDEQDVVDWDKRAGVVAAAENCGAFASVLETLSCSMDGDT